MGVGVEGWVKKSETKLIASILKQDQKHTQKMFILIRRHKTFTHFRWKCPFEAANRQIIH